MILHLTFLNVILNILPSCGNICVSGLRCRPSVTTSTGVNRPQLCVPSEHYNVLYIRLINLLVAWRVYGCRENAYIYIMIFKHVYHEIPRQHYNELISNRLVGHTSL